MPPSALAGAQRWLDWCEATGARTSDRSAEQLARFVAQASPSQRELDALRQNAPAQPVTAWTRTVSTDPDALKVLLERGSGRINDPKTHWIDRLRLRRLLFVAVLVAPSARSGGLGLTREQVSTMTPRSFAPLRNKVGSNAERYACPSCAVWSWLEVLGTNSGWRHGMVKSLAHRVDTAPPDIHRHTLADPEPAWSDWPDVANLVPAIDRWGYIEPLSSLHRSSVSALIESMTWLLAEPAQVVSPVVQTQRPNASALSPQEEQRILRRADELNARIARILDERV